MPTATACRRLCNHDDCYHHQHIRHQHLTGFYKRIVQGNSPQDIEAWRAERRKNWPTRLKIAEKIVEQEALRERGEVRAQFYAL